MKLSRGLPQPIAQQIAELLAETYGVDARSLDRSRLQWVIEGRCRHLHLSSAESYAERLRSSAEEMEAFIDAIVVPETRFFRDPAVFEHLRSWLTQLASEIPENLRVLSAPCSTGQEAYSLAATLRLAGVPLSRFTIDAFDISTTAINTALRGQYSEAALRHLAPELQQACGTLHHKHWKMHDELRQRVHFCRCNLAQPGALDSSQPYHLIFCRNLFIYLHPQARAALAQSLAAVLAPGGRLVLGSADRVEELNHLFSPIKPAAAFAFTHRSATPAAAISSPTPLPPSAPHRTHAVVIKVPAHPSMEPLSTASGLYHRALEHQQHGELRKAERRCRQALYLDPTMLPALELLEKLWSSQPNLRLRRALEARILRHRAESEPPSANASASFQETA